MTDQHPLTDKNCSAIEDDLIRESGYDYDDFMCMRAGADWQLEQVIDFILKEDTVYYDDPALLADYIREAMRPTTITQENN